MAAATATANGTATDDLLHTAAQLGQSIRRNGPEASSVALSTMICPSNNAAAGTSSFIAAVHLRRRTRRRHLLRVGGW